jgi:hypothetical protein
MTALETSIITIDFIGTALIAITVLLVHHKVSKEKKIDKIVLKQLKLEQLIGFAGLILIILGYLMKLTLL